MEEVIPLSLSSRKPERTKWKVERAFQAVLGWRQVRHGRFVTVGN